jgi:hypothetical protein
LDADADRLEAFVQPMRRKRVDGAKEHKNGEDAVHLAVYFTP